MGDLPTIFEWLERFSWLRGLPATAVVVGLLLLILLGRRWTVTAAALLGFYLVMGLLYVDLLEPRLAAIKVLVGLFVCLMQVLTARQADPDRLAPAGARLPLSLRLFIGALLVLAAAVLGSNPATRLGVLAAPAVAHLNVAVYGIAGLAGALLLLAPDPWRRGTAVLLLIAAFELVYSAVAPTLPMLLALAAINLTVAVAIAYLTQAAARLAAE